MDATIEWLTGCTILKAERRGVCVELDTMKGQDRHLVIMGGHHLYHDLRCMGCQEERQIEIVETAGRQEAFCPVCSRSWKLDPKG